MNHNKNLLVFTLVLILLITLFSLNSISYFFLSSDDAPPIIINFFVNYHLFFMFLVTLLAIIFGFISYLFMTKNIVNSSKKFEELLNEFLILLDNEERKVIEFLIKNKGVATQYEIVKASNCGKVKIHRIIEKMILKEIITKQKIGKINKIYLNKKFMPEYLTKNI